MALAPLTITITNPQPGDAPTTLGAFVTLLAGLISAIVPGTFLPYVLGNTTPIVGDQDKIWAQNDVDGRPTGMLAYYGGSWRRFSDHRLNEIVYYSGDPAVDFDGTGLGLAGGRMDGFRLCNGQNATPDLSDKFIVAAHMDGLNPTDVPGQPNPLGRPGDGIPQYVTSWQTEQDSVATATGGATGITMNALNTFQPTLPAIKVGGIKANANSTQNGGNMIGLVGPAGQTTLVPADAGVPTPARINTMPPFYALAMVIWKGYV